MRAEYCTQVNGQIVKRHSKTIEKDCCTDKEAKLSDCCGIIIIVELQC
jgi:hypothetical protein